MNLSNFDDKILLNLPKPKDCNSFENDKEKAYKVFNFFDARIIQPYKGGRIINCKVNDNLLKLTDEDIFVEYFHSENNKILVNKTNPNCSFSIIITKEIYEENMEPLKLKFVDIHNNDLSKIYEVELNNAIAYR